VNNNSSSNSSNNINNNNDNSCPSEMEEKLTELQENHFSLYDTSCKDYDNYIVKRNVRTLSITGK